MESAHGQGAAPEAGARELPDPARHTVYSDPGPYADRLRELPSDLSALCAAARNVVVHYRAQLPAFTDDRLPEVDSRWVEQILARDQHRFGSPLLAERPLTDRVAGCCRDQLHAWYAAGGRLRPGDTVVQHHPLGPGQEVVRLR